jgi:hypothetical protein
MVALVNGEIEKVCQHAFSVAEKFFPRWEVEKERLTETLAKLPEASGGDAPEHPWRATSHRQR